MAGLMFQPSDCLLLARLKNSGFFFYLITCVESAAGTRPRMYPVRKKSKAVQPWTYHHGTEGRRTSHIACPPHPSANQRLLNLYPRKAVKEKRTRPTNSSQSLSRSPLVIASIG